MKRLKREEKEINSERKKRKNGNFFKMKCVKFLKMNGTIYIPGGIIKNRSACNLQKRLISLNFARFFHLLFYGSSCSYLFYYPVNSFFYTQIYLFKIYGVL